MSLRPYRPLRGGLLHGCTAAGAGSRVVVAGGVGEGAFGCKQKCGGLEEGRGHGEAVGSLNCSTSGPSHLLDIDSY
jgi:hypothetical protein